MIHLDSTFAWLNYQIVSPNKIERSVFIDMLNTPLFEFSFIGRPERIILYSELFKLLKNKLLYFDFRNDDLFAKNGNVLKDEINRLLIRNKLYKDHTISLFFFASAQHPFNLLIQTHPQKPIRYNQSAQIIHNPPHLTSNNFSINKALHFSFELENIKRQSIKHSNNSEKLIFANDLYSGSPGGELFLIKNNIIHCFQNPIDSLEHATTQYILKLASNIGLTPKILPTISLENILSSEEVFFYSMENNFSCIFQVKDKRYFSIQTKKIIELYHKN